MPTLLAINSSPQGAASASRALVEHFAATWTKKTGGTVRQRDASGRSIPHVDGALIGAFFTPPAARTAEQKALLAPSDEMIAELKSADAVVIGVAMHNFGVPSSLKAYVDHVIRVGETFSYGATGPVGLINDKPLYLLRTSGGDYSAAPMLGFNHAETFLGDIFRFVGLKTQHTVSANGLAMGGDARDEGLTKAKAQIDALLA